jgi:hypothetical protein
VRDLLASRNPFATRYTRPGQLRYVFPPGQEPEGLISRLRTSGWWGQIVGPHGSGKSTLLAELVPALEAAGRRVVLIELHDGQRRLPASIVQQVKLEAASQWAIDGYEQLTRWQRLAIKRRCRLAGCGLLVTAHGSVGLPELCCTRPDLETAHRIVQSLLGEHAAVIPAGEIERSFYQQRGNLREMLFALYDVYERRRPEIAAAMEL